MTARALRIAALAAALAAPVPAYDTTGGTWASGDIVLHLQLGPPAAPLLDGAADWNAVASSAMDDWNAQLGRSRLVPAPDSTAEVRSGNRINNVVLRPDVFGTAFDSRTLAVTVGFTNRATARFSEQDVVFNANLAWNSYRGPLRSGTRDLRRVALHEFGHVLGLDHPDEATPPQTVTAIMNSTVGNLEVLSADDIAGARALYTTGTSGPLPTLPVIVAQPQSRTVPVGGTYTFSVTATGSGPFTYAWFFRAEGSPFAESLPFATGASYTLGSVQRVDAGTYTAYVRGPGGLTLSSAARLTVAAGPALTPATQLANLSTRGRVEDGAGVLIAGLAVTGPAAKSVLVRAARAPPARRG
ncbi:MAG: matrixin family metalloprotease, partial [Opitutaceae bacterium]